MKGVLDGIRTNIGAENCCESCSRDGCRVFLQDVPRERIVVDADRAFEAHGQQGQRCDFILFALEGCRKLLAAPLELKSGSVDVSEALEQLRNGAAFAERFSPKGPEVVCRPVLFHGRRIHRKDLLKLNRSKIRFRGVPLTVKISRCNRPWNLADALRRKT